LHYAPVIKQANFITSIDLFLAILNYILDSE
jgi:hypothetical protein